MTTKGEAKTVLEPWQGKLQRWIIYEPGNDREFIVYSRTLSESRAVFARRGPCEMMFNFLSKPDRRNAHAKLLTEDWWKA